MLAEAYTDFLMKNFSEGIMNKSALRQEFAAQARAMARSAQFCGADRAADWRTISRSEAKVQSESGQMVLAYVPLYRAYPSGGSSTTHCFCLFRGGDAYTDTNFRHELSPNTEWLFRSQMAFDGMAFFAEAR